MSKFYENLSFLYFCSRQVFVNEPIQMHTNKLDPRVHFAGIAFIISVIREAVLDVTKGKIKRNSVSLYSPIFVNKRAVFLYKLRLSQKRKSVIISKDMYCGGIKFIGTKI